MASERPDPQPSADPSAADPLAHWPDRAPLYDGDRLLLVFSRVEALREGRPWVDGVWRPPGVSIAEAADAALTTFAGHAFSTFDHTLADALVDLDATELRHAVGMTHALAALPEVAVDPPLAISTMTADLLLDHAAELGEVNAAAYDAGHPDHAHPDAAAAAAELVLFARGEILGPVLPASTLATWEGRPVGACVVVDRGGDPPDEGPWVGDVFRDPRLPVRGIGAALIAGSLARARDLGLPAVGLVVTHANASAARLYRRLGFTQTDEAWTVLLPG